MLKKTNGLKRGGWVATESMHLFERWNGPWPLSTHAFTRESRTLTGKSGSVSCGDTAPFPWVLVCTRFCRALQESVSPVLWKFCNQIPLVFKVKFSRGSQSLCQILRLGNLLWVLELWPCRKTEENPSSLWKDWKICHRIWRRNYEL